LNAWTKDGKIGDQKNLFAKNSARSAREMWSMGIYLNQCDVIFLNMQRFLLRAKDQEILEYLEQAVLEELREAYGDYFPEQTLFLAEALEKIYTRTEKHVLPKGLTKPIWKQLPS
jgi:hypothetical protein